VSVTETPGHGPLQVATTGGLSLIRQRLDDFMKSTQGLPTDLRIEAMESVAAHVMLGVKSMQYEAQRLRGEVEGL
jgi:hypothetical protein